MRLSSLLSITDKFSNYLVLKKSLLHVEYIFAKQILGQHTNDSKNYTKPNRNQLVTALVKTLDEKIFFYFIYFYA